jgi:hypothetical protein
MDHRLKYVVVGWGVGVDLADRARVEQVRQEYANHAEGQAQVGS